MSCTYEPVHQAKHTSERFWGYSCEERIGESLGSHGFWLHPIGKYLNRETCLIFPTLQQSHRTRERKILLPYSLWISLVLATKNNTAVKTKFRLDYNKHLFPTQVYVVYTVWPPMNHDNFDHLKYPNDFISTWVYHYLSLLYNFQACVTLSSNHLPFRHILLTCYPI